ncbi:MAG: DoxX family protein [Acidimicrobiia bacterium]|nr:MAG: DoxX family protein [Acidimicrobiia bacterium]
MEPYDFASLLLRLALGGVMLAHGIKHARGKEKTSRWFGSIGFKYSTIQWFASTATEIGVGFLLIVGFLTTAAVAGVIGIMTVAFFSVHRSVGFWITARPDEGWEYVMLIAVAGTALAMFGPGQVSIDDAINVGSTTLALGLDGWVGLAGAGLGLAAGLLQLATFFRPGDVESA